MRNNKIKPSCVCGDALPKRNNKQSQTVGSIESSNDSNKMGSDKFDELSLLSISAAARIMKVGKSRIYELIENGKLKIADLNGTIRIPYFELKRCLESLSKYSPSVNKSLMATQLKSYVTTTPQNIMDGIKKLRTKNE